MVSKQEPKFKVGDVVKFINYYKQLYIIEILDVTNGNYHYKKLNEDEEYISSGTIANIDNKGEKFTKLHKALL